MAGKKSQLPPKHRVAVGNHIRLLRKSRGMSQEALALAAGLDRSYLGGVERGQRNVALDNLVKLGVALQVPAFELLNTTPPV